MVDRVNTSGAPRTRRAERAEQTRRSILEAATALFVERGYPSTTIEAVAAGADVAVETVYSRFRTKANLLTAILEPAIVGGSEGHDLLRHPEIELIGATTDQRRQIQLLARFSRGILERTHTPHTILRTAVGSDPTAAELQRRDARRRCDVQRHYIDMLVANGPLRDGLTSGQAADTYSALANPTTYDFLVGERGWTPDQFQAWLADCLIRALL